MFYSFKDGKTYISIRATTKAHKNYIGEEKNGELTVYVTSAPENNKANKAIIELFTDAFKIAKSKIHVVSGEKSRNKKICIDEIVCVDSLKI